MTLLIIGRTQIIGEVSRMPLPLIAISIKKIRS